MRFYCQRRSAVFVEKFAVMTSHWPSWLLALITSESSSFIWNLVSFVSSCTGKSAWILGIAFVNVFRTNLCCVSDITQRCSLCISITGIFSTCFWETLAGLLFEPTSFSWFSPRRYFFTVTFILMLPLLGWYEITPSSNLAFAMRFSFYGWRL